MKLQSNHVLIRLTKKTDELQLGDITMSVETVFDEERHQRLVGIVEQVPDQLIFENFNHNHMPWECDMEVEIGDEVIIRRTDVSVARHEGMSFEIDGHLHVYIHYKALILATREISEEDAEEIKNNIDGKFDLDANAIMQMGVYKKVIMLNGYMLVEQDDTDLGTNLTLPQNMKEIKAQTGTIRFLGKPNRRYHDQFNSSGDPITGNLPDEKFDLQVGDRIGFLKFSSVDLEFAIHQTFGMKGVQLGRLQRNKVLCKL